MPNSENHYENLPKTPPRANQAAIPKAAAAPKAAKVKPASLGKMLGKLNMHTYKVDQDAIDQALGNDREVEDGFGGFGKQQ